MSRNISRPLVVSQVQGNALHALGALQEPGGDIALGSAGCCGRPSARQRARYPGPGSPRTGISHLDDLGAKTRQGHAEVGARQEHRYGKHPDIAQWLHREYHAFLLFGYRRPQYTPPPVGAHSEKESGTADAAIPLS